MSTRVQQQYGANAAVDIANNAVLASKSRSDQARYITWQHAMRPEDTGHAEGLAGVPAATDLLSHFESKVRDNLTSRLGVVRNQFAEDDAKLATELVTIGPEYKHYRSLLEEKRTVVNRPILIRMDRRSGIIACVAATVLAATLMGVLWIDKGIHPFAGFLIALFGAAIASISAYPCGLTLRQGVQAWQKWLAVGLLAIVVTSVIVVFANMRTPSFDMVERVAIGVLISFAILSVSASAFMMHDQDPVFSGIEQKHIEMHKKLSKLQIARAENIVYHTNNGRRHVEIARQMISSYRQSNCRSRAPDVRPPEFFNVSPVLPEVSDDWLTFLEVKQQ